MRQFNRMILSSTPDDLMAVVNYQIENFDLTKLWGKGEVTESLDEVKLFADKELAKPDLMGNPISWQICSDRLIEIWKPKIQNDVQLIKIPIYDHETEEVVADYQILNPLRHIEGALNLEKSTILKRKNRITTVTEFVFNVDKIPSDLHIFRPAEFPKAIIVSDSLFEDLVEKGIKGIAFIKCESV